MSTNYSVYSVSQLSQQVKQLLEMSYIDIWVEGEVSSLATPTSGHTYFTLKENSNILKCVLFKNKKYLAAQLPSIGKRVLIRGRVSMYTARGEVQLICAYIECAGEGELRRQFDDLKNKLKREGLFEQAQKQALPSYPNFIALITSPHGAVLHDIITTLKRRYPCTTLRIYPASVQGDQAKEQILQSLALAEADSPDLIIFARGGGSLEDLQAFNDEDIARAVFQSPIPCVSAIGHETDFCIIDFVSDKRAATPTSAATLSAPDIGELKEKLSQFQKILNSKTQTVCDASQQLLDTYRNSLKHPHDRLLILKATVRQLKFRLESSQRDVIQRDTRRLQTQKDKLNARTPEAGVKQNLNELRTLNEKLIYLISSRVQHYISRYRTLEAQLEALNPDHTLARGYAIVQNSQGEIIKQATQVWAGEAIVARLKEGSVTAQVTESQETNQDIDQG